MALEVFLGAEPWPVVTAARRPGSPRSAREPAGAGRPPGPAGRRPRRGPVTTARTPLLPAFRLPRPAGTGRRTVRRPLVRPGARAVHGQTIRRHRRLTRSAEAEQTDRLTRT